MLTRRLFALAGLALFALAGCARESAPQLAYNDRADVLRQLLESGVEAGGGGGGASLGEPTGWATVRGTFRILGPAPPRSPVDVTKDQATCAPGGVAPLGEDIVVDESTGGIRDVLIYVSSRLPQDDPRWVHDSYEADKFAEVLFDQKDCIFLSHVAAMRATQKLLVKNSDPVGHNTNLDSKRGARSANFTVAAGDTSIYEPGAPSPAPFPISCSIHPWMKANLMVCDHPYFAVTDAQGNFEIANVPAGVPLEFRVWQEAAGFLGEVTVNDAAEKWSKGRFKLTLTDQETRELNVQVNNTVFQ